MAKRKKVQKDKQRFTQLTQKTKDRVTRIPLKSEGELRCSRKVSSYCSNSGIRSVNLVTNPVINHDSGKGFTANDKQYYSLLIPNPNANPKL